MVNWSIHPQGLYSNTPLTHKVISLARHDDQTLADISNPLPSGSKGHLKGSTIRPGFANLNVSPEKGSQGRGAGQSSLPGTTQSLILSAWGMIRLDNVTHPGQEHQTATNSTLLRALLSVTEQENKRHITSPRCDWQLVYTQFQTQSYVCEITQVTRSDKIGNVYIE